MALGGAAVTLTTLATAIAFLQAARLVGNLPVTPDARRARSLFATWWYCAAGVVATLALHTLLASRGLTDTAPHLAVMYTRGILLTVALWSLLGYLAFLYSGSYRPLVPLGLFYAVFLVLQFWYYDAIGPWAVEVGPWATQLTGRGDAATSLTPWFGALVGVPVVAAALLYAGLLFRPMDAASRYRVTLVSLAFLTWFGAVVAALATGQQGEPWFPLTYLVPGFVGAVIVNVAFRPPGRLRRRFRSVDASSAPDFRGTRFGGKMRRRI